MDTPETGDKGYIIYLCSSGETSPRNLLASTFLRKYDNPTPIMETLSTMPVNKSVLGLQNMVVSTKKNR